MLYDAGLQGTVFVVLFAAMSCMQAGAMLSCGTLWCRFRGSCAVESSNCVRNPLWCEGLAAHCGKVVMKITIVDIHSAAGGVNHSPW